MDLEEIPAVVIDNGSDTIMAGMAGDDAPSVLFPTLISGSGEQVQMNPMREWRNVGPASIVNYYKLN